MADDNEKKTTYQLFCEKCAKEGKTPPTYTNFYKYLYGEYLKAKPENVKSYSINIDEFYERYNSNENYKLADATEKTTAPELKNSKLEDRSTFSKLKGKDASSVSFEYHPEQYDAGNSTIGKMRQKMFSISQSIYGISNNIQKAGDGKIDLSGITNNSLSTLRNIYKNLEDLIWTTNKIAASEKDIGDRVNSGDDDKKIDKLTAALLATAYLDYLISDEKDREDLIKAYKKEFNDGKDVTTVKFSEWFGKYVTSDEGIKSKVISLYDYLEAVKATGATLSSGFVGAFGKDYLLSKKGEYRKLEELETTKEEAEKKKEEEAKENANSNSDNTAPSGGGGGRYSSGGSGGSSKTKSKVLEEGIGTIPSYPEPGSGVVPPAVGPNTGTDSTPTPETPTENITTSPSTTENIVTKPSSTGGEAPVITNQTGSTGVDSPPSTENISTQAVVPGETVTTQQGTYRSGGSFGEGGYESDGTTIEAATTEGTVDDALTSLNDTIKGGSTPQIARVNNRAIDTSKTAGGNSAIPLAAGLSAAAAAGLGAKTYLDRKKNKEDDDFDTDDWSNSKDIDINYDDDQPKDDDYLSDEDEFSYNSDPTLEIGNIS